MLLPRNLVYIKPPRESFLAVPTTAVWRTRSAHAPHQEHPLIWRAVVDCEEV